MSNSHFMLLVSLDGEREFCRRKAVHSQKNGTRVKRECSSVLVMQSDMYLFFFTPGEYSEVGEMKGGVKTNTKDMLKGKSDGKEIAVGQE